MHANIFLVAGEKSGDRLGSFLIQSLKQTHPHLSFTGISGPLMEQEGCSSFYSIEDLQVMGFIDVALALPSLMKIFNHTVQAIIEQKPDIVITIDYPGFNLRLAKALRKKGFKGKLCHCVCPSIWAWGQQRIHTLTTHYDLLLTILPFEKQLFSHTQLPVTYIGHPLAFQSQCDDLSSSKTLAFFPGSRKKEIERNLPGYIRLIHALQQIDPSFNYVISVSSEKYLPLICAKIQDPSISLLNPVQMQKVNPFLAIAKCGTIILELALKKIPTVVTYQMSSLDILLAKYFFRIQLPYYSLPNIILNEMIFPELIGPQLTDHRLLDTVSSLIHSLPRRKVMQQKCQTMRDHLEAEKDFSSLAAKAILDLIF